MGAGPRYPTDENLINCWRRLLERNQSLLLRLPETEDVLINADAVTHHSMAK